MNKTTLTDEQLSRLEVFLTMVSKMKFEFHSSDLVPAAHWIATGTNIYDGGEEVPLDTEGDLDDA